MGPLQAVCCELGHVPPVWLCNRKFQLSLRFWGGFGGPGEGSLAIPQSSFPKAVAEDYGRRTRGSSHRCQH